MSAWNLLRLELARSAEFPGGSASRAYMLRVPLDPAGLIDEAALAQKPALATVRRFWPNQPDLTGQLMRSGKDWVFSCALSGDDEAVYRFEDQPLRVGDCVTLAEPDGSRLPFRVVRAQPEVSRGD
jgi:hypothetical protein